MTTEKIKFDAKDLLFEMDRLDNVDIDSQSLTLDEIWSQMRKFLNGVINS